MQLLGGLDVDPDIIPLLAVLAIFVGSARQIGRIPDLHSDTVRAGNGEVNLWITFAGPGSHNGVRVVEASGRGDQHRILGMDGLSSRQPLPVIIERLTVIAQWGSGISTVQVYHIKRLNKLFVFRYLDDWSRCLDIITGNF